MENAKQLPNYNLLRKPRTRAIRQLNNIFIVTDIAKKAVEDAHKKLSSGSMTKLSFTIPTIKDDKVVIARNRTEIISILEKTVNYDLFSQALVPAVAVTEDYLSDMIVLILRSFPKKLGGTEKKIDLKLVLEAESLDKILESVIFKQIHEAFYAPPAKYFEYLEKTLSITLPDTCKSKYSEVKATRDIFVHNAGIVNRIYLQKAGKLARAGDDEPLPIDELYFNSAITYMKRVVQSVYQRLLKKYGKSRELGA